MTDANQAPGPPAGRDAEPAAAENAPAPDFDPKSLAKSLLRATRAGALATVDRNTGSPLRLAGQCRDRQQRRRAFDPYFPAFHSHRQS